ncbi:hypothetical protein [Faecalibacillus faecis]|uniref:hypothetical protein n=1 Tax=Faecalibacillus faecis TaxID=1982628 RepID=UPI003866B1D4
MAVSKYYREFNPNPLDKECGDCVIRSLCAVTEKSWYEIYDMLSNLGKELACPFDSIDIKDYDFYTHIFGMTRYKVSREKGKKALNVERFCKEHFTGKYILRLANHMMGVVDGKYYELYPGWEDATVYTYWRL